MADRSAPTRAPAALSLLPIPQMPLSNMDSDRSNGDSVLESPNETEDVTTTPTSSSLATTELEEDETQSSNSDSSPDVQTEDSTDSSGSFFKFYDDERDEDVDMMEKIYFLREKQQILGRATAVLNRKPEAIYAAATATKLCRRLPTTSSSSSLEEERGVQSSIWSEAKRVLKDIKRSENEDVVRLVPVPTVIYRKRCAPNPMNPLISTRAVKVVSSKLYESGDSCSCNTTSELSDTDIVKPFVALPVSSDNQVR